MVQPLSDELKANLTTIREKIQQWTYKGYKRLESLRNSKLEHDAIKSASGDASLPVRVDSESGHLGAIGHQTGDAGTRAGEVTSAHLVLVEQRFMDWNMHSREEVESKLKDLHCQDLTFGGRAFSALRIYEEDLVRTVTGHIAIYEGVSHEFRNSDMLSRSQLDQFRERIMTSVRWSLVSLKDRLERDKAASGDPYPVPEPHRYSMIESKVLDVVNSKLRMLETKGAIAEAGSAPRQSSKIDSGDVYKREKPQTDPTRASEWQTTQPESDALMAQASMSARVSSSIDAIVMESPTRIEFEAGLALAEVTLDQDLKEHGPSLEIARKYVVAATLTFAKCILTPKCTEPHEAIQRAYDFSEWFAGKTIKTLWVWLCVFSEMNPPGKLKKYNHAGRPEDGPPEGISESEIREWHGCLYGVAHEALDQFVPVFWKERLKYFAGIASGGVRVVSETARAAEFGQNGDPLAQEPADLRGSDVSRQADAKQRPDKARKGDGTLLSEKRLVSFGRAEEYLGVSDRQRQKLIRGGALKVEGQGHNRKITVESLKIYLPPEIPN